MQALQHLVTVAGEEFGWAHGHRSWHTKSIGQCFYGLFKPAHGPWPGGTKLLSATVPLRRPHTGHRYRLLRSPTLNVEHITQQG